MIQTMQSKALALKKKKAMPKITLASRTKAATKTYIKPTASIKPKAAGKITPTKLAVKTQASKVMPKLSPSVSGRVIGKPISTTASDAYKKAKENLANLQGLRNEKAIEYKPISTTASDATSDMGMKRWEPRQAEKKKKLLNTIASRKKVSPIVGN